MAIKDRFRRALRRSDSSESMTHTDTNTTTTTANTSQSSLGNYGNNSTENHTQGSKTSSSSSSLRPTLSKTWTWGSRDKEKEREKSEAKKKRKSKKPVHPSEKPLTAQNLRHQEMLSQFTMTFGTSNRSQIELPGWGGISPCCTRAPSIDLDALSIAPDDIRE